MPSNPKSLLSVVLATHNEAENLERCLESVTSLHPEIVIVDGESSDDTVKIAHKYGSLVISAPNQANFHINKQMAIEAATGEWVLLLDADEVVSPALARDVREILGGKLPPPTQKRLLLKHQRILEKRDGVVGVDEGEFVAFFVPRINMFLGKPLTHGGSYPDGVIRFFKRGKAGLPARDVHEQMRVDGRVGWLEHALLHYDSPTFSKYIARANRYTSFTAQQWYDRKIPIHFFNDLKYLIFLPKLTFLKIYFRHKGFMDGFPGFVWALFSGLHYALAYMKLGDLYRHARSH